MRLTAEAVTAESAHLCVGGQRPCSRRTEMCPAPTAALGPERVSETTPLWQNGIRVQGLSLSSSREAFLVAVPTPGNIPLPSSSRGNRPPIGCGRLRLRRHDSERFEAAPRLQDARGRRSLGLPDAAQSTGRPAGRLTAHAGRAHTRRVLAREIGLPSTHREGGPNPF